jgi:predicted small integral membrane protein
VHLIWLALVPAPLWGATLLSAGLAVVVFRKV